MGGSSQRRFFRVVRFALWSMLALTVWLLPGRAFAKGGQPAEPLMLDVKDAPAAYYYPPKGSGPRPVIMYLHGRGANPQEDCRKWAKVGTAFGWVVCPQGGEDRGGGSRAWANSADSGQHIMDAVLNALRAKYKGRVRARNHILVGFSEGAFIAQQVGLRDPQKWSRWLILAASDRYWVGDVKTELSHARSKLRRVYLLTGENDGVVENTQRTGDLLRQAKVNVKVRIVPQMGHELPHDKMVTTYKKPLLWLSAGK